MAFSRRIGRRTGFTRRSLCPLFPRQSCEADSIPAPSWSSFSHLAMALCSECHRQPELANCVHSLATAEDADMMCQHRCDMLASSWSCGECMIPASCCCGAVKFEISVAPTKMATCHCSRCRKLGATPFVFIRSESIRWISGQELVSVYKPDLPFTYPRCFCSRCGSSLGEIISDEAMVPIPANCLDSDVSLRNTFHEFVRDKPSWLAIGDEAPRHEAHPTRAAPQ
jgi:hypothetical protein